LRRRDLDLHWRQGEVVDEEIVVPRSKTESGTGRVVPLTNRARRALAAWLRRFSDADRSSYVFPLHRIGMAGASRKTLLWGMDFNRLMGQWSYKAAFETARQKCGIACRFLHAILLLPGSRKTPLSRWRLFAN